MLGVVEAEIQTEMARRETIRAAAEDYHGRIQLRVVGLDQEGGGEPGLRARLVTARYWALVAGS